MWCKSISVSLISLSRRFIFWYFKFEIKVKFSSNLSGSTLLNESSESKLSKFLVSRYFWKAKLYKGQIVQKSSSLISYTISYRSKFIFKNIWSSILIYILYWSLGSSIGWYKKIISHLSIYPSTTLQKFIGNSTF